MKRRQAPCTVAAYLPWSRFIAIGALLLTTQTAFALNPALEISQYAHTSWKIRDGFIKGWITAMAQTADGYLWLGTELGLVRFDGVRFVPWQPPAGQSLPSSFIRALLAARDGTLWIGTVDGVATWKDGALTTPLEFAGFGVSSMFEDREGTLWITGTATEAGRLCAVRRAAVECHGDDGRFGHWTASLYETLDGLWVAAENGLWQWTRESPKRYSLATPSFGGLQALTARDDDGLLIITTAGIREFGNGNTIDFRLPGTRGLKMKPSLLHRDRDGGLWIGTADRGLVHVHAGRSDQFTRSDGLSGDVVYHSFEDREGNIWFATSDGLDRFREFAVPTFSAAQGLSNPVVASIFATDGGLWVNAGGILDRWELPQVTVRHTDVTASPETGSFFQDRRGRLWVSRVGSVGYVEDDRFITAKEVPGDIVNSIDEDTRGNLWFLTQNSGVLRLLPSNAVESIPWSALGSDDHATRLAADPVRGGVWLGFFRGGISHYVDGQIRESYAEGDGLARGRIDYLSVDRDATVWAASVGGLSRVKNRRVATLSSRSGLPCDAVDWMIADDADSYWLYMECGFVRIAGSELRAWAAAIDANREQPTIRTTLFDSSDGVRSVANISTYSPHIAKSADGRLWFAGPDGFSVVEPRRLPFNQRAPPVHVEQIVADRTIYDARTIANGALRLPPLTRDVQIDYTALSLVAPEKMKFRYKLEGWDRDWQDVGTRRQAFYANLPPRDYRFRVIASNNSGVWNETGATVDFTIAPAYYQTTWFPVISAGMMLGLIWAAHRMRVRIVEKHEREIGALNERLMNAQEQERIRIAGELHDGVMQEMLAATMMLGSAKRRVAGDSDAKATIDKVQEKLIRVGTDIRQLSHDLHPPVLQEQGLPEAVRTYCEQFSASSGVPVACEADDSARDLSRGAALALFRIVQEALGNAAKHAHATQITVRLARSADDVSLTVSDNGAGFDANRLAASGGLGLVMMRERATQLNGTFEFDSAPGRGTTIRVVIPFR